MTEKFYYKYIPLRRGLTGNEYLSQWLDEYYPDTSFESVISDGMAEFGILTGSGESFSKAIAAIEGNFSAVRLTEESFIGIVKKYYNPIEIMDGETPPTFVEYMAKFGITTIEEPLLEVKISKIDLLKEIVKKKCENNNDSISDLAKSTVLLTLWYDELTTEEKNNIDTNIGILKNIYTKEHCIDSFNHMVTSTLSETLSGYYTKKEEIMAATDIDTVNSITY